MSLFLYKVKKNKVKFILLALPFIFLCIIIAVFIKHRNTVKKPEQFVSAMPKEVDVSLGEIYHEAIKNGKKEWCLKALAGNYAEASKQMILKKLSVTFFLKDNSEITLTADGGILNTNSNDMDVSGNIIVKNKDYTVFADKFHYDHNNRIIHADAPVKIEGETINLTAQTMTVNLNTNKLQLDGDVAGILSDKLM